MTDVIKSSELSAASFIDIKDNLSYGQRNLLQLLKEKISSNTAITKSDIIDCYIKSCSKDGKTIRYRYNLSQKYGSIVCRYFTKEDKEILRFAKSWFQNNLGACILKGKLLVIPIIDINEEENNSTGNEQGSICQP